MNLRLILNKEYNSITGRYSKVWYRFELGEKFVAVTDSECERFFESRLTKASERRDYELEQSVQTENGVLRLGTVIRIRYELCQLENDFIALEANGVVYMVNLPPYRSIHITNEQERRAKEEDWRKHWRARDPEWINKFG